MNQSQFIAALNEDLQKEFSAVIQYSIYAAQCSGPYRPQLTAFFEAEVPDEINHAKILANKIVTLGGTPTLTAAPVKSASTNKEMLEAILAAETDAARRYTERALQAEELGMKGFQVQLEDMVRDETDHRDETERILRDWNL